MMEKIKLIFKKLYKKNINTKIINKTKKVSLLICDVDGVMSNGFIYVGNKNEELKSFNVKDNYGIRCLLNEKIEVAIITGRNSILTKNYCYSLGIKYVYQGQLDKIVAFNKLLKILSLNPKQVAYIGDDLIDFLVMKKVGLSIAVSDSHPILKQKSDYITYNAGGYGAVREICDLILLTQNKLNKYFN